MEDYHFNFESQKMLTHFLSIFNGVKIKRFDGSKYEKELIKVPMTFAPKSHILADLIGKTDTIRLPIIAFNKKSDGRDNERIRNKLDEVNYKNSDGSYVTLKAVPWNIEVEMTILAKYQEDVDQIISNFAVNANPYVIASWREPKSNREVRIEVLWDGNISYETPGNNQGPKDPPFRITATTAFTIKGYIYKTVISNAVPICRIDTEYIFTDKFYCNYDQLVAHTSASQTDYYTITGRPVIRYMSPYNMKVGSERSITIQGFGFENVQSVYVSGSPGMFTHTAYDPLTSGAIAFNGLLIDEFSKSPNSITFTVPSPSAIGFIDVIAVNECGYGLLTEDANRCNRVENPYPTTSPEHYSWCVLQFPYLNGIIVSDDLNTDVIDYTKQIIYVEEEPQLDRDAIIEKIKELMALGEITVDDL